jgi:hypothetical protein
MSTMTVEHDDNYYERRSRFRNFAKIGLSATYFAGALIPIGTLLAATQVMNRQDMLLNPNMPYLAAAAVSLSLLGMVSPIFTPSNRWTRQITDYLENRHQNKQAQKNRSEDVTSENTSSNSIGENMESGVIGKISSIRQQNFASKKDHKNNTQINHKP